MKLVPGASKFARVTRYQVNQVNQPGKQKSLIVFTSTLLSFTENNKTVSLKDKLNDS